MLLIAFLALLLWPRIRQVLAVAAVQNSVQHDVFIAFGLGTAPVHLPESIDSAVNELFKRSFKLPGDHGGPETPIDYHRVIIDRERFRAFFREPIDAICINPIGSFRGDVGAALARFPKLRFVTLTERREMLPTEAEWKLLCTGLRAIPDLEEIELGGIWITDAALAPLSGHPKIRKLTINFGRLHDKSIETFASMPRLNELVIGGMVAERDIWPTFESTKKLKAALPNVKINARRNFIEPEPTTESAPQ